MLDEFEYPLPHFAIRKNSGKLEVGLQLFTRDGRRLGNSFIKSVYTETYYYPHEASYEIFECMTDMGNVFKLSQEEVDEYFHLGDYIMDVEEAINSRQKEEWGDV